LQFVSFFAAGAVLSKKLACTHNYAPVSGNATVPIEHTLPSSTTLKNNNQSTMVTQEHLTGNGGASEVGKRR
jgi:hypothetical protein